MATRCDTRTAGPRGGFLMRRSQLVLVFDERGKVAMALRSFVERRRRNWAFLRVPHITPQNAFGRVLKAAGLPGHYSCNSLRHSYASLLLADGVSPTYVQEQLGHASIELTVGTYGRWLRKRAPEAVDRLDGKEVVAKGPGMVAARNSGPRNPEPVLATH